jgi:hypothetical protein
MAVVWIVSDDPSIIEQLCWCALKTKQRRKRQWTSKKKKELLSEAN